MILKNSLDDRSFTDIVEEALRLVPRYCPEWTNHNPSDPGVTLIELFAWMTEMTLYRLGRVPEKTYLALLELLGLYPSPPQPARALVEFYPAAGAGKPILLKQGLKIAAAGGAGGCVFETERDLVIAPNSLAACVNRLGEKWSDFCRDGSCEPFPLFAAADAVEHILYVAAPSFAYLAENHTVEVSFDAGRDIPAQEFSAGAQAEAVNYLSWEYWNGRAWTTLPALRAAAGKKRRDNTLYFRGPEDIAPRAVNGKDAFWLRAVLTGIPEALTLSVRGISLRTYFGGEGFVPGLCFSCSDAGYTPVDMNGVFRIFSENPAYNETFYLSADGIFSRPGISVSVVFSFSEIYVPGGENTDARFSWEYWNGGAWTELPRLRDGTLGFRQAGTVSFPVPRDAAAREVSGEERYWIRVRLLSKDFSLGGAYVKDENENWVWRFSSKVHSPVFSRVRVSFDAGKELPQAVFSYTNFAWRDLTFAFCGEGEAAPLPDAAAPRGEVSLFELSGGGHPALFLGFQEAFPPPETALYFRMGGKTSGKRENLSALFPEDGQGGGEDARQLSLVWEYWNGSAWASLAVNDYTDLFHQSGFVEFASPPDFARTKEFGRELFWLRVSFVAGSFEARPVVRKITLNAVYAQNAASHTREIAGSGTGGPGQQIRPAHGPLLPGLELYVDEGSVPPAKEIEAMKAAGIRAPYFEEAGRVWVRYTEQPNLYASGPLSRHFVVDYESGVIVFGDGRRGVPPPKGKFNIMLFSYKTGGGEAGNVAPGVLRVPERSIPFVAGCDNPFPAEGGADRETTESLKTRAAGIFQSGGRAVSAGDFECLAREASASVGRAVCLPLKSRRGEIRIAVIPFPRAGAETAERLIPSREILRRVRAYLDERRLAGTKLSVEAPVYRAFSVFLTLRVSGGVHDRERLKKDITAGLHKAFHALTGGAGGGWEFGKAVTPGAVFKQLEKTDGILSVDEAALFDIDAGVVVEKLLLKDDELPFLEEVRISDRNAV